MTSPVRTVGENDTVQQVCKIMVQNNVGSVIVIAESGSNVSVPAGIVTERDVVRHLAEKPISFAAAASQIMSSPVVTIRPNGSLRDALQAMQTRDIRRLVVVGDDGSNMVGIITSKDIFRFIARNESVSSAFVSEEVLTRDREMAERFSTSLFDDIINRRP